MISEEEVDGVIYLLRTHGATALCWVALVAALLACIVHPEDHDRPKLTAYRRRST